MYCGGGWGVRKGVGSSSKFVRSFLRLRGRSEEDADSMNVFVRRSLTARWSKSVNCGK